LFMNTVLSPQTASDYYGEDGGWPHISSSFGQFDLAGFPKAQAEWWRAWWLYNVSTTDPGRSPVQVPAGRTYGLQIVEEWAPDAWGNTPDTIHVYTSAPSVHLQLTPEGSSKSLPLGDGSVAKYGYASISVNGTKFQPGVIEAFALDHTGKRTGDSAVRCTAGAPYALRVTLDAPAQTTGTGSYLYADGSDVALVRAVLVDEYGCKCSMASYNATFEVLQGAGAVVGVANGDPSSHEPNAATWRSLYHGMTRAVVKVTVDARPASIQWANQIDLDRSPGGVQVRALVPQDQQIVVRASVPGLGITGEVSIGLSADEQASALSAAVGSKVFVDAFMDNSFV